LISAKLVKRGLLSAAVGSALALTAACGGSSSASTSGGKHAAPARSVAQIRVSPGVGATGVDTTGAVKLAVAEGRFTKVSVTAPDGTPVPGTLAAGKALWTPSGTLRTHTEYAVSATAVDSKGLTTTKDSNFTTLTPATRNIAYFNVDPGQTYGVGIEASLTFKYPVADESRVGKAITVTASDGVPVVGHWFTNQRLDFRPESYWKPGTKAVLHLALDGVQTSKGVYGTQYKDVPFSIGRSQISVADDNSKTLKVYRDGKRIRTIAISLGAPGHTTYNGRMVIMEQDQTVDMDSRTVGLGNSYNIKDVPHAQRLSTSGTFIHGNYWRPTSVFGSEDTSHGCVGMHDVQGGGDSSTPASWFYHHSMLGDVVQVVHSPDTTVQPDNGWNGWNMSWSAWTSQS
jgi:lipoprotein-anchoring transpeptidase ErfK/SrfK